MRQFGQAAFVLLLSLLAAVPAAHAKRVALVIGNQGYNDKVGPLRNPHNDIVLVGKALTEVGFKLLTPRKDATRDEMLFAVHELAAQVRSAGRDAVSFLYYAGHGVGVGAENVLIPTNADDTTDAMLSIRGVRLSEILDLLKREAPDAAHFVVLDACRNNLRGRRGERGFVPVNDRRTGVVIAFSTAQGETATDEGAKSAPYAAALAEEIVKAGRNDQQVFNAVRTRVVSATGNQTPWTHDGLIGERVVFKVAPVQPAPVTVAPPSAQPRLSEAAEAWGVTKDTTSIAALEAFIRRFGDTYYGDLAKVRLAEVKQAEASRQAADAARKKADDDARAKTEAERQRLAMLQQEEERKRAEAEVARKRAEAAELAKAGRVFRDCPDCPEMVVVPAGSFTMGSPASEPERETWQKGTESPQLKVTISEPFAVGKFAITFDEWDACVAGGGCNGYRPGDQGWGRGKRPVINVNWDDAKAYVAWLARKTGKSYRLLSEAEREYVTRAGTTTPFWWGSSISATQANYDGSAAPYQGGGSKGEYRQKTVPVDSFAANPWGLYQVHGNVWEWTEDCWNDSHAGNPGNGSARTTGNCGRRVVRGGSWYYVPQYLRAADRSGLSTDVRGDVNGFRVGRTLTP